MFSFEEYMIAWAVYLLSSLALMGVFWHLTRNISLTYVKESLRLLVATLLLVPAAVDNTSGLLAPAWVKAGLQLVFSGMEGFLPVGRLLLLSLLIVFLIYVVLLIAQIFYRRKYAQ